uniref:Poly(ADP-ribose) polymerase family member 12 n=1 Tax=Apteryx owenii TaxID=8824 RepID=A0A8B9QGZ7_APTOW
MSHPVFTVSFENELSGEAIVEKGDLSCFLERLKDLWDSQQPHSLVLFMYCTGVEFFSFLLSSCGAFIGWLTFSLVAVRLCPEHGAGCTGRCGRLHLCKYHLKGVCRNQRFVHNFYSEHNLCVLKQYGLEILNGDELRQLLLQNDPSLLPEVCSHYNKGDGPYGSCTYKKICTKLHICQYFLQGQCRFGSSCKRSHDFLNSECYEKLERQGMSSDIIEKLPSTYRNMYDIKNGTRNMLIIPPLERKHSSSQESSTMNDDESEQICLYHLYKRCVFKDKCIRVHFHLPYKWQISDGNTWNDLKNMEEIEAAYCDPSKTSNGVTESGSVLPCICFRSMCCGFAKVRRLSTASSVTKPPHFILTTEWIWYWKDEYGLWQEYGKKVTMIQKNLRYTTEREVCRRPKFVSQTELIKLDSSSDEYKKVQVDFQRTMPKTIIQGIHRVQNPSLWELYQWQKEQMQKSNGGKAVDERFLFHGTSKKHIDAICQQNFDWRICGLHGTVYGKGSYFARDASYSDNYCREDSHIKTMFLARVLVGEFTLGSSSYVRPPLKDNQNSFYDSCVNSLSNPSIFVIFEKQQIYPEYLIEYIDQILAEMLRQHKQSS